MASLASRLKVMLLNVKLGRAAGVALALILGLIVLRAAYGPARGSGVGPYGANRLNAVLAQSKEFSRYLEAMHDTRPAECIPKITALPKELKPKSVSIVIHFNEDQFFDAKLTLHSVIEHTREDEYDELVLLDDGSKSVEPEVQKFLKQKAFGKLKVYRTDLPGGEASSKYKASKLAQGEVLVFLSTRTIVNKGWLSPLVRAVMENEQRIATPHVDNFLSGYRFFENKKNLVNVMSLTLGTYYYEAPEVDATEPGVTTVSYVDNPVLRGDAFAIRKSYLERVGDFDEGIDVGGGENLELSLRTWLCGGQIKLIPCSRVATHDALKPTLITNAGNIRRIADLWLGSIKSLIYNQADLKFPLHEPEDSEVSAWLRMRQNYLKKNLPNACHDFNWYHENVAKMMQIPNLLPRHFGTLGDRNSLCIRRREVTHPHPEILDVVHCRSHTYDPRKLIEMTARGNLMMDDRCLRVEASGQVILGRCLGAGTDNGNPDSQRWDMDLKGQIYLRGKSDVCLTHKMERNRQNELVHFLAMDDCDDLREQLWTFIEY